MLKIPYRNFLFSCYNDPMCFRPFPPLSGRMVSGLCIGLALACVLCHAVCAFSVEPICLDRISARGDDNPDGRSVTIALVELAEVLDGAADTTAVIANLEHQVFAHLQDVRLFSYDSPQAALAYSSHATMLAGIIAGDGAGDLGGMLGSFPYRGVIPQAALSFYEARWFIYHHVILPGAPCPDADVINLSWGTDADDRISRWWQRGLDHLVTREALMVIAAAGNDTDGRIQKPAAGYNILSIAAAEPLGGFPDTFYYVAAPSGCFQSDGNDPAIVDLIAPGVMLGPSSDSVDAFVYDRRHFTIQQLCLCAGQWHMRHAH